MILPSVDRLLKRNTERGIDGIGPIIRLGNVPFSESAGLGLGVFTLQ